MNTIVLTLLGLVAAVCAQGGFGDFGGDFGGGDHHHHLEEYIDYRAKPHYKWDYAVHDGHTHDIKQQVEHRDGKDTVGKYELLQPDGRKRIVEYRAGKHGAEYKVRYEGHSVHGGIGAGGDF